MTNTLRRIYKQNMQLPPDGYPSAPEHQSSNSEFSPDSPVKSPLYAELDKTSQQTRSIVGLPINSNSTINAMNLKSSGQKKIRHRRIGSADLTFNLPPMPIDRRTVSETKQVKMVHTETQTDTMDLSADISVCSLAMHHELIAPSNNSQLQRHMSNDSLANDNGNISTDNDTVDHETLCSKSTEQLAYDYMNSNEHLDIRESSDDDNLEKLDRRVSQFFNENRLVHADNGNGGSTMIDSRALFNVMAARRSLIISDKDQVTVISRSNKSTTNVYNTPSQAEYIGKRSGSIQDHNCNNDDGDDSWTDEEGEDSDNNYTSLRRKR